MQCNGTLPFILAKYLGVACFDVLGSLLTFRLSTTRTSIWTSCDCTSTIVSLVLSCRLKNMAKLKGTRLGAFRAYYFGFFVCTAGFLFGYDTGIVGMLAVPPKLV